VGCSRARTLKGLFIDWGFKPPECSLTDPIELKMQNVKSRELEFTPFDAIVLEKPDGQL